MFSSPRLELSFMSKPGPSSRTSNTQVALELEQDLRGGRLRRVLGDVLERLEHAEVGRRLDVLGIARRALDHDVDRHGRLERGGAHRAGQPVRGERRREDPCGQRAQLVEDAVDVVGQPLEQLACAGRAAGHHVLGELEPDPQRDQPLLAAVVEVALDPPALVVGRREDPRARGPQLAARAVDPLGEPLVLVPDEGVRADRLDERPLLAAASRRG